MNELEVKKDTFVEPVDERPFTEVVSEQEVQPMVSKKEDPKMMHIIEEMISPKYSTGFLIF